MSDDPNGAGRRGSWAYWLLIIPFIATLWVPFYNAVEPSWRGIPYFYWYQFLWILISAVLTAVVYFVTDRH
jgi:amino acid transporter